MRRAANILNFVSGLRFCSPLCVHANMFGENFWGPYLRKILQVCASHATRHSFRPIHLHTNRKNALCRRFPPPRALGSVHTRAWPLGQLQRAQAQGKGQAAWRLHRLQTSSRTAASPNSLTTNGAANEAAARRPPDWQEQKCACSRHARNTTHALRARALIREQRSSVSTETTISAW